jgi:hypothetical protein
MLVLLAIGPEERHGYAIMAEVARITDGATRLGPGGVYTTIRRLVDDGLIEETDERPDPELDDQRRRYYRLTATGRRSRRPRSALTALAIPAVGLGVPPDDRPASRERVFEPSSASTGAAPSATISSSWRRPLRRRVRGGRGAFALVASSTSP